MKIGYARVSTEEQSLELQLDALIKHGCESDFIYTEKVSGSKADRPELLRLIESLRKGDQVVVWKLDRLGRSVKDLISIMNQIKDKGAEFISLQDHINTGTPSGKLTFHMFAALAEFERDIIRERTKAGLASARVRGRKGGRPKGLSKEAQHKAIIAENLYKENLLSTTEICQQLSISRNTLYSYLKYRKVQIGSYRKKEK